MRHIGFFLAVLAVVAAAIWYNVDTRRFPIRLGLDLQGGARFVLQVDHAKTQEQGIRVDTTTMEQVRDILERRVTPLGLSGADVRRKGPDQIEILLPGARDIRKVEEDLIKPAHLEFRWLKSVQTQRNPSRRYRMEEVKGSRGQPATYQFFEGDQLVPEAQVLKEAELIISGRNLQPKSVQDTDLTSGEIVVNFELQPDGARTFADFTRQHVGEHLAIVLDGKIISAPVVEQPITGGKGIIRGGFTIQEARDLAVLLNSGALPVPLSVVERQEVGATLGAESVRASVQAGLMGLGLVLLFMLGYYLLPGLLANIALIFYAALTFALYKLLNVTMDLPGITGFILSVGMAVDANILIFERLKEEMRAGKTLHAAIDAGFSRAFSSIFDSNVSTWITCFILYQLGAPLIKGFAITLALGVAVSMFTAITVSRTMLHLVVNWDWARRDRLFGLGISWLSFRLGERNLNVMGQRKFWLLLTATVMLVSVVLLIRPGLNLGIDFTGGSQVQVTYGQPVEQARLHAAVEEVVRKHGITDARITLGRTNQVWTQVSATGGEVSVATADSLRERLRNLHGAETVTVEKRDQTLSVNAVFSSEHQREALDALFRGFNIPKLQLNVTHENKGQLPVVLVLTKQKADNEAVKALYNDLKALPFGAVEFASGLTFIGSSVARALVRGAVLSIVLASLALILYLGYRFAIGGFVNGLKFGSAAILTLLHDVLFALGLFAVMGHLRGWQVDSFFVTAALTVIGYSVHDTIVVFDRIREHMRNRLPRETLEELVNRSITQTFDRSLNTSLTVILVLVALLIWGGASIKPFNAALLAGIGIGTYSSIFVASPLVVIWERASQRAAAEARKRQDVALKPSRPAPASGSPAGRRERDGDGQPEVLAKAAEARTGRVNERPETRSAPRPAPRATIRPKRKRRS